MPRVGVERAAAVWHAGSGSVKSASRPRTLWRWHSPEARRIADCGLRIADCPLRNPKSEIRNSASSVRFTNHRGQHLTEYALVVAVAVAAFASMSTYVRRAIQGRAKAYTDVFLGLNDQVDIPPTACASKGDLNGDGDITRIEVARVENFVNGVPGCQYRECYLGSCTVTNPDFCPSTLSAHEQELADINGDGKVDQLDVKLMYALSRGIITQQDLNGGAGQIPDQLADHLYDYLFRVGNPIITPEEFAAFDLDHNGTIDAADLLYARRIQLLKGFNIILLADPAYTVASFNGQPIYTWYPRSPDFNGDGRVTPAEVNRALNLFYQRYGLSPQFPNPDPSVPSPQDLAIVDASRDGNFDLTDMDHILAWGLWDINGSTAPRLGQAPPPCTAGGQKAGEETQRLGIEYEQGGSAVVLGDANGDGKVTAADLTAVIGYLSGSTSLSAKQFDAADVNGDGKVDQNDLNGIIDLALGHAPAPTSTFDTSSTSVQTEIGIAHTIGVKENQRVTRSGRSVVRGERQLPLQFIRRNPIKLHDSGNTTQGGSEPGGTTAP